MLRNIGRVLAYCMLPKWLIIEYPLAPRPLRPRLFRHWFSFPEFVPSACLPGEAKGKCFYQYTAIDEFSRWRYVEAFEEHSTYSSMIFLVHLVQAFPMPIECVQTDNGTEFTKRFTKASLDEDLTLFERKLKEYGNLQKIHSMISSARYNICLTNQQLGKDTCQFYTLINKKGAVAYAATPKKSSN